MPPPLTTTGGHGHRHRHRWQHHRGPADAADADDAVTLRSRPLRALGRRRPPREVLAPPWRRWLVDNLARGVAPDELRRVLAAHGVPAREVARACTTPGRSPPPRASSPPGRAASSSSSNCAAPCGPRRSSAAPPPTPPSSTPATGRPAPPRSSPTSSRRWPAFNNWTLAHLRDHYGHAEIESEWGRDADPDCDVRYAEHRRTTTLAAFLDHIATGTANDVYAIANNRNLARPELRPLLNDVNFPDGWISADRLHLGSALWIGPAGTVTSLHHDTSNILFCQVLGRKRVHLVAPDEPALLRHTRGVYSRLDPERPGPEWQDTSNPTT
jgi:hypothetical protein